MAKRSRLTAKPGQRRPLQRSTRLESSDRPSGRVTAAEEARAAELEAAIGMRVWRISALRRAGLKELLREAHRLVHVPAAR